MKTMYTWMWWSKGECVVRVIKTGHFPNTVIVQLPNDKETEVEADELLDPNQSEGAVNGQTKSFN